MNNNDLNKILQNGDPKKLMSQLSAEDTELLNSLLKDENARKKFLASTEAQQLLKMLYGG